MTKFPNYHKATNAAYLLLKKFQAPLYDITIETDVFHILSRLPNIRVYDYTEACAKFGYSRNSLTCVSDHGFTIKHGNRYIVLYNDFKDETTIRFTLAHEIGHIVLDHAEETQAAEKESNCFARNLLCPVYIRDKLGLITEQDYCETFNVSRLVASISMEQRNLDFHHINSTIYGELFTIFSQSLVNRWIYANSVG